MKNLLSKRKTRILLHKEKRKKVFIFRQTNSVALLKDILFLLLGYTVFMDTFYVVISLESLTIR